LFYVKNILALKHWTGKQGFIISAWNNIELPDYQAVPQRSFILAKRPVKTPLLTKIKSLPRQGELTPNLF
jgi:hypothetical protein